MLKNIIFISCFQLVLSYFIISLSKKLNLLDKPSNRKKHKIEVPFTGGIILSFTYLFSVFITNYDLLFINLILSYSFVIAVSGFLDDKYKFNPGTKLVFQILPILLIIDQNLFLLDLGEYYLFGKIILGSFDKIFTVLCLLFLINAFNYSDGIDGLTSLISIVIIISYSFFAFIFLKQAITEYLIIVCFPLLIFFIFNFNFIKGFKVFLGDSGSNLLGFMVGFIAIYLHRVEEIHAALIIWPLSFITYEFLSVNLYRAIKSRNIFEPGRDHIHYILHDIYKLNYNIILILLFLLNMFLIVLGSLAFFFLGTDASLFLFIVILIIYISIRLSIKKLKTL